MFDKLIESGMQGGRKRRGGYLAGATVVYFGFLISAATAAIMWFNPGFAEALEMKTQLIPPPPAQGERLPETPRQRLQPRAASASVPTATATVSRQISDKAVIEPYNASNPDHRLATGTLVPRGNNLGIIGGIPGANGPVGVAPAVRPDPPPPTPIPVVAVPPTPSRVSEGVLRGRAISNFTPPYPEIARRARISGPVQVQIMISEDGRVIEASVLSGHPLLRQEAVTAARRWVFSATKLSGVPVKVQGILTFNFKLD